MTDLSAHHRQNAPTRWQPSHAHSGVNMTKSMLDTKFEDCFCDEAIPYSLFLASCLIQILKGEVLPIFMPPCSLYPKSATTLKTISSSSPRRARSLVRLRRRPATRSILPQTRRLLRTEDPRSETMKVMPVTLDNTSEGNSLLKCMRMVIGTL